MRDMPLWWLESSVVVIDSFMNSMALELMRFLSFSLLLVGQSYKRLIESLFFRRFRVFIYILLIY